MERAPSCHQQVVPPRRRRWVLGLAFALPLLLALPWCALMRPQAGSALAPLFGPWAGHLYGHSDCTMASAFPGPSLVLLGLALPLGLAAWRARRRGRLTVLVVLIVSWSIAWSLSALLSVVNSTS